MKAILRFLLGWLKWIIGGILSLVVLFLLNIPVFLIEDGVNNSVQTIGWILLIVIVLPTIGITFRSIFKLWRWHDI